MINMPLSQIKEKIIKEGSLSEAELDTKIKEKMDKLSGLISEEGAAHIIANELGIKLFEVSGKLQVQNILAGMSNVEVSGKVVKKYEVREFATEKRKGKVGSFLIADETGLIRVVLWNDQTDLFEKFNEGDVVRINNGPFRDMLAVFDGPTTPTERVIVLLSGISGSVRLRISSATLDKVSEPANSSVGSLVTMRQRRTRGRGRRIS